MITSLKVENFKGIRSLDIPQFYGVNLFLGVNETSKTGLMKLMYAMVKAIRTGAIKRTRLLNDVTGLGYIEGKLVDTFNPRINGLLELLPIGSRPETELRVSFGYSIIDMDCQKELIISQKAKVEGQNGRLEWNSRYTPSGSNSITDYGLIEQEAPDALFIPPKEILTVLGEISYARDKGERKGFDDTYIDLMRALLRSQDHEIGHESLTKIAKFLEGQFDGNIKFDEGSRDFVYVLQDHKLSISMAAEGIRKLATIYTLIHNKELEPGMMLFIDEPETSLHPHVTRQFMRAIVELGKAGVQVFMASHDYFVLKELQMLAVEQNYPIGCYSLLKRQGQDVKLDWADLRERMPDNEIVNESVRMFEKSVNLQINNGK